MTHTNPSRLLLYAYSPGQKVPLVSAILAVPDLRELNIGKDKREIKWKKLW
jgi:hypothetical protein